MPLAYFLNASRLKEKAVAVYDPVRLLLEEKLSRLAVTDEVFTGHAQHSTVRTPASDERSD